MNAYEQIKFNLAHQNVLLQPPSYPLFFSASDSLPLYHNVSRHLTAFVRMHYYLISCRYVTCVDVHSHCTRCRRVVYMYHTSKYLTSRQICTPHPTAFPSFISRISYIKLIKQRFQNRNDCFDGILT